jgi:hypothetical protein
MTKKAKEPGVTWQVRKWVALKEHGKLRVENRLVVMVPGGGFVISRNSSTARFYPNECFFDSNREALSAFSEEGEERWVVVRRRFDGWLKLFKAKVFYTHVGKSVEETAVRLDDVADQYVNSPLRAFHSFSTKREALRHIATFIASMVLQAEERVNGCEEQLEAAKETLAHLKSVQRECTRSKVKVAPPDAYARNVVKNRRIGRAGRRKR